MPECKYCKTVLKWKQPYKAGDRPVQLNGKPHECKDSPWAKKQNTNSSKYYDPFNGNRGAELRYKEAIDKAEAYCEDCKTYYLLRDPCDHHIPDGYMWKERRVEVEKKRKERIEKLAEQAEYIKTEEENVDHIPQYDAEKSSLEGYL